MTTTQRAIALTPREQEVAKHLVRGMTNKQIAAVLGIGVLTVRDHVSSLLKKYRVNRRTELVAQLVGVD